MTNITGGALTGGGSSGGGASGGFALVDSGTTTAGTDTVALPDKDYIKIIIRNLGVSGAGGFAAYMQLSTNGGSTYLTSSGDYGYKMVQTNTGVTLSSKLSNTNGGILISPTSSAAATFDIILEIFGASTSSDRTIVKVMSFLRAASDGNPTGEELWGMGRATAAATHNAFKLIDLAGSTLSGYDYVIYAS